MPDEVTQPGSIRKGRGRPPKHPGTNQYTGIRAKNIDYVRQLLRHFLELPETKNKPMSRDVVWSCRMLLACEGIYLNNHPFKRFKHKEVQSRLIEIGANIAGGSTGLPDLLDQVDTLESMPYEAEETDDSF